MYLNNIILINTFLIVKNTNISLYFGSKLLILIQIVPLHYFLTLSGT